MNNFLIIALLFGAEAEPSSDFDADVMPVFTKAGCNVGSCHGAAIGRGGFKLSLYGSDAAADYRVIVHELEGRRINLASPQQSLLLLKWIATRPYQLNDVGAKIGQKHRHEGAWMVVREVHYAQAGKRAVSRQRASQSFREFGTLICRALQGIARPAPELTGFWGLQPCLAPLQ